MGALPPGNPSWTRCADLPGSTARRFLRVLVGKLGENASQSKHEDLHSEFRRGNPEAVPHKMAPKNGENRGVFSGEEHHKRGRGGGKPGDEKVVIERSVTETF